MNPISDNPWLFNSIIAKAGITQGEIWYNCAEKNNNINNRNN